MEINKVDELLESKEIERLRLRKPTRQCLLYKTEKCEAPDKMAFPACRTCYRIDSRFIVPNLFRQIVNMAAKLFNFQGIEPGPPPEGL